MIAWSEIHYTDAAAGVARASKLWAGVLSSGEPTRPYATEGMRHNVYVA